MSSTAIDPTPEARVRNPRSGVADARRAVIDVGSNSVRLVVFEGLARAPLPVFNERVLCGIGRDLAETGALHEDGVDLALSTIGRFVAISREIGAGVPEAVATAAVREAVNGREFVARARDACGLEVRVLSGTEDRACRPWAPRRRFPAPTESWAIWGAAASNWSGSIRAT